MSLNDDRRSGMERRAPGSGTALPNEWLFQEFSSLRDLVTEQHSRIRSEMSNGFARMHAEFRAHEDADRGVERRVHDIEQREKNAADTVSKRNITMSGLVAAIVGPAAAWLFAKFFGGPPQ